MSSIYLYGLVGWVILVILALLNATIREEVYGPFLTPLLAHQISTFIMIIIIFLFTYIFLGILHLQATIRQYLLLGLLWLVLTILFEFIFGHYIMGHSWDKLLADYNLLQGRIWVLVPIATALMPWIVSKIR